KMDVNPAENIELHIHHRNLSLFCLSVSHLLFLFVSRLIVSPAHGSLHLWQIGHGVQTGSHYTHPYYALLPPYKNIPNHYVRDPSTVLVYSGSASQSSHRQDHLWCNLYLLRLVLINSVPNVVLPRNITQREFHEEH